MTRSLNASGGDRGERAGGGDAQVRGPKAERFRESADLPRNQGTEPPNSSHAPIAVLASRFGAARLTTSSPATTGAPAGTDAANA